MTGYYPGSELLQKKLGEGLSQGVDLAFLQTRISLVGYFWTTPKNTLPLKENPKKYFMKSETLKNTLLKHNSLSES